MIFSRKNKFEVCPPLEGVGGGQGYVCLSVVENEVMQII